MNAVKLGQFEIILLPARRDLSDMAKAVLDNSLPNGQWFYDVTFREMITDHRRDSHLCDLHNYGMARVAEHDLTLGDSPGH